MAPWRIRLRRMAGRSAPLPFRMTLNQLEALLAPEEFLRVHRSTIVRRDQIASLTSGGDGTWRLKLRGGGEVPVSERYIGVLKSAMG